MARCWVQQRNIEMRSFYSILDSILTAGTIYGWRLDAIMVGGLLWALASGYTRVRLAVV
ncbi:MAG TPA: hypothetical protein VFR68_11950 [Candidatus Dormibacteraeota bacterium]|nr:hypothetical protein [Candidatus Dormibacteraeota bacterium]